MWRAVGLSILVSGALTVGAGVLVGDVHAVGAAVPSPAPTTTALLLAETPAPPAPEPAVVPVATPTPAPVHPSFAPLAQRIAAITAAAGGRVSVTLVELGGPAPSSLSVNGSARIDAASTYKLPALIDEARLIAAGTNSGSGQLCYQDADWEDGWFTDYSPGDCYTRTELAQRAGHFSDNTAGHMLVRDLGGSSALNAFATSLGARNSSFFEGNTTTSDDLASLLVAEASGAVGGAAAQAWLYPLLTHTNYESGIPAGIPSTARAVHKTGQLDPVVSDAAIVSGGRNGTYVLTVLTSEPGGSDGWAEIAQVSAAVWQYEAARQS